MPRTTVRSNPRRTTAALGLAVALAFGLAACGDDDEAASDTTDTTTATTDPGTEEGAEVGALGALGCDAFAELTAAFVGDPTAAREPAVALIGAASAEVRDDAVAVADAFDAAIDDPEALGSPGFAEAWSAVGDAAFASCDVVDRLDVEGIDYAFDGIPAQLEAGRHAIRLTNASESGEPHELVLVKRLPGADAPVAELLQLPPDELFSQVEMAAVVFVDEVGGAATALVDLEPGRYIAVCTLPTAGEESDPHAAHGMTQEVEVS